MEDFHSLSSQLLCQETESCLDEEELDEETFVHPEDDEYVQILLNKEITVGFESPYSQIPINSWINCARSDAITWIFKTRASFGLQFQTAYLSVIYFDRFISRGMIDGQKFWAIRLLSVACLSLAAKMEECTAPTLPEFTKEFESRVIQRMELLVLNTLKWRMGLVTPFAYIHYFTVKFSKDQSHPKNVISKTAQLILAVIGDVNLMGRRPSVIAGAATLVALDSKLTKQALEQKINDLFFSEFIEIDDVFHCYNQMQELDANRITTPNSSITSAIRPKRNKGLLYHYDQNQGVFDEKPQG
ncbi:hypothetical protein NMG60_11016522 [Bertholletia excelsa]